MPRELLLSHNVAVLCERGRWLVAYGGMAHERGSEDWHGGDFGVMRALPTPARRSSHGRGRGS